MKYSKAEVHCKTHGVSAPRCEDSQLTSFSGLILLQALFVHLGLKERLRRCFSHLTGSPIFGHATLVLCLVLHVMLGYRRLRDVRYCSDDPLVMRTLGLRRLPDVATLQGHPDQQSLGCPQDARLPQRPGPGGDLAELKSDNALGYVPTRTWVGNQIYLLSVLLAQNLGHELQVIAHPPSGATLEKRRPSGPPNAWTRFGAGSSNVPAASFDLRGSSPSACPPIRSKRSCSTTSRPCNPRLRSPTKRNLCNDRGYLSNHAKSPERRKTIMIPSKDPIEAAGPKRVIVFAPHLLPYSETFISEQVRAIRHWQPVLVGERQTPNGLSLEGLDVRLLCHPDEGHLHRWIYTAYGLLGLPHPPSVQHLLGIGASYSTRTSALAP